LRPNCILGDQELQSLDLFVSRGELLTFAKELFVFSKKLFVLGKNLFVLGGDQGLQCFVI
jgi:hypothetical protein